jgi:hypothetical protein
MPKLILKSDRELFRKHGRQEEKGPQAIVVARYFHPTSNYTFYATEYEEETEKFFGYISLHEDEWGYVAKSDLETRAGRFHLTCERDSSFKPKPLLAALRDDRKEYRLRVISDAA